MRSLFAWLYAPLFLFGFLALGLWTTAHHPTYWLAALLVPAIALSFLAEAGLPYEPQWNRPRGDRLRDGLHALFNESQSLLGVSVIPLAATWLQGLDTWPNHWPLIFQLLLAVLVADLGVTLMHYLSHRLEPLWRLHAVHHSVQRLYGFNGLMKHPLHQAVEALAGTAPLLLLGMPQGIAALLAFAIALQLLLQHSNVDMRIGPLRHLFAWAPVHRFHHMKYGRAGDVNFALFFSFWDRLLGTAFHSDYPLGVHDLGIGSRPDYPRNYLAQLIEPFRPQPHGTSPEAPEGLRQV
ncbi:MULTISPECIES: sterol desaturase family protein [unclassified Pseudomonas]|uniref:sterol desaturase family protein n=1 Tax=unclassified Pseudomonas TaxID=196821 RepID=UPI00129EA87D|nr:MULTISPECIES: sterol desaturase family protein [unclassified Pseudomonas]MDH4652493.1 sterol desaturase family protein [Pseudomonas sp. BN606]MRK20824.1 sterol desaturase family protein [Pseudomonas sp. JG-B]